MRTLRYDEALAEGGLEDYLLRAHSEPEFAIPLALLETYEALGDLRRSRALGRGIFADVLGLERGSGRLALIEMKHPNHWKTGPSALHQIFAYAAYLCRAVDADEAACGRELAATLPAASAAALLSSLARWRASRRATAPLGNLSLVCVVPGHPSWELTTSLLRAYGLDLRAVNASMLLEPDGRPSALGWFEMDAEARRCRSVDAFRWEIPRLASLGAHPIAGIEPPAGAVWRRSDRDFTARLGVELHGSETLIGTFTPMTGDRVLVEILDEHARAGWQAHLLAMEDEGDVRRLAETLREAAAGLGA